MKLGATQLRWWRVWVLLLVVFSSTVAAAHVDVADHTRLAPECHLCHMARTGSTVVPSATVAVAAPVVVITTVEWHDVLTAATVSRDPLGSRSPPAR